MKKIHDEHSIKILSQVRFCLSRCLGMKELRNGGHILFLKLALVFSEGRANNIILMRTLLARTSLIAILTLSSEF